MELQKRSLHMETPRLHASKQVVLEDNVIIPDTNKDADKLLLDRGKITIEEVSSFEDAVTVKGKLHFKALYLTEGNRDGIPVSQMEGSIPFEEKLQMEGLRAGEHVHVKAVLEELGISLINSRNVFVIELLAKHCPSGNFTRISPFVLVRFSLLGLSCATKSSPNSIFNPKDNCSFIAFNCRNFVSEFDCVLRYQPLQTGFIHSLYLGYISFDNNGRWHDSSFILAITPSPNSCIVAIIVSVVLL